jgi:hypothetical protein
MNNELETILDDCLNQLEEGKATIEECLARHPAHAAQLKPLLQAANMLARGRDVMPSPQYRMRARSQLNVYMQQNPQRKRVSPIFWRVSIGFVTVLLLFLASGTAFAQQALPGDALYTWKLTSENLWRMTSSDPVGVDIAVAERRFYELLSVSQDDARLERAIRNYERVLIKFRNLSPQDRERILPMLQLHYEALRERGVSVPELEGYFPR